MSRKVLIVGQGLAGSLLAHELDLRGADLLVIDPGRTETATRVAAGLLNPFTGPRFQSPEPPQAWFACAVQGWRRMEQRLSTRLLREMTVYRLIRDASELERMQERRTEPDSTELLGAWLPPEASGLLNDPLGRTAIRAARVNLPRFLDRTRDWLHAHGRLVSGELDYADLAFKADHARWKHHELAAVVCCQGYQARRNPWFAALPWRMSHGESLVLRTTDEWPDHVVSRGRNLVPLDRGQAWLGATYGRQAEPTTTAAGRQTLLDGLGELFREAPKVEVVEHRAGVRAGNRHGFYFCHRHPVESRLLIFGGLGSRGTLIAPACASALAAHLADGAPLSTAPGQLS